MRAREQLLPLTGIRFILALWVVFFHQKAALTIKNAAIHGLLDSGYVAVGFFFVLSGFVLAYNYSLNAPWSKKDVQGFAVARFARIYPAYMVGLALMMPVVLFGSDGILHDMTRVPRVIRDVALNVVLVQAWVPNAALSLNSPGWSLCAEAFFYAMFPFIGVFLWKVNRPRHLILAGLAAWIAALVAPILLVTYPLKEPGFWINLVKFNPMLRLPEFCMGIITARTFQVLQHVGANWRNRGYVFYLPALLLTVVILSRSELIPHVVLHNGALMPLYALLILGLAFDGGLLGKVLSCRGLVYLGNSSYALYILHYPVVFGLIVIGKRVLGKEPSGAGWVLFVSAVSLGVACAAFSFFEERMNRSIRKRFRSPAIRHPQSVPGEELVAIERADFPVSAAKSIFTSTKVNFLP